MMRAGLLALGLTLMALPGQAATMKAVFEGAFGSDGVANPPLFGFDKPTVIFGQAFVVTVTYDTDVPSRLTNATADRIGVGGLLGATLQINGVTENLGPFQVGIVSTELFSGFTLFSLSL